MIHTKRVNRLRESISPYRRQVWNAYGGIYSLYFAALGGALGYHLGGLTMREVIPSAQFLSKLGFKTYVSRIGLWVVLPALTLSAVSADVFGDREQFFRLIEQPHFYRQELKNYKQELYYS